MEETLDLSFDRLLMMVMMRVFINIRKIVVTICRDIRHRCVQTVMCVSRDGDMNWSLGTEHLHSLGAFAKLPKANIRHVMFVYLLVRPR